MWAPGQDVTQARPRCNSAGVARVATPADLRRLPFLETWRVCPGDDQERHDPGEARDAGQCCEQNMRAHNLTRPIGFSLFSFVQNGVQV
jgi:hypothetical protein